VVLQRAVPPVATERRYAAPHAAPWLDAAGELHGTTAQRAAPLPEGPLGGPWRVAVPLDGPWQAVLLVGLRAQPRHRGRGLFPLGRMSRCSPQSRRHQVTMLQRGR